MNTLSPTKRFIAIGAPVALVLLAVLWVLAAVAPGLLVVAQLYTLLLVAAVACGVVAFWIYMVHLSYGWMIKDQDWGAVFAFLYMLIPGFLVVVICMGATFALARTMFS